MRKYAESSVVDPHTFGFNADLDPDPAFLVNANPHPDAGN
jgi:hypothetical protein